MRHQVVEARARRRVRRPGRPRSRGPGRTGASSRRTAGVLPAATTRAVLVVLDLDQRRLGVTGEARDRPRVRVGFLELVDRLRHQQLLPLRQRHGPLHVAGGARPRESPVHGVEGRDETTLAGDVGKGSGQVTNGVAQLGLERRLQGCAQREDGRRPLPPLVDMGEAAVLELVEAPQRQLGVAVLQHGACHPRRQRDEATLGHLVRWVDEHAEGRVTECTSSTRDAGRSLRRQAAATASCAPTTIGSTLVPRPARPESPVRVPPAAPGGYFGCDLRGSPDRLALVAAADDALLRPSHQRHSAVMMIAPTNEPMIPLACSSRPSPASRLINRPTDERADEAGHDRHGPVDTAAGPSEDQLRACADQHAEQDDAEDEHGVSITPARAQDAIIPRG